MTLVLDRLGAQLTTSYVIVFPVEERLEKPKEIPPAEEEIKEVKKVPELPDYCYQTLGNLFETIKLEIAEPLLKAQRLEKEFQRLRDPFSMLRFSLNSYLMYIKTEYPEEWQRLLTEGLEELESGAIEKALVNKEILETFLGLSRFSVRLAEDFFHLLEHLEITKEPEPSLYEVATDFDMCYFSALFPIAGDLEIKGDKELQNLQTLVGWAKKFALNYAAEISGFLKAQLSLPQNAKLRQEFYADKISEFIGSGPKGVYEALLEERRKERALENG